MSAASKQSRASNHPAEGIPADFRVESLPTRRPAAPLAAPAIGMVVGVGISDALVGPYAGLTPALFAGAAGMLLLAFAGAGPRSVRIASLAGVGLLLGMLRHQIAVVPVPDDIARAAGDEPQMTRVAGVVVTAPLARPAVRHNPFLFYDALPRTRFVLRVEELRAAAPRPASGFVRVSVATDRLDVRLGDRVQVSGMLHRPRGPRNPGAFDWRRWNALQGIHASLFVERPELVQIESRATGPPAWLDRARALAQACLFEPFTAADAGEHRQLLDAMVLGHRSAVSAATNEAFARTGALHFLSVSGFHVALLGWLVWGVARYLARRGPRAAAALTSLVLITYALIAEPNAPILRATVMGVLVCLATIAGRPRSTLNALAAAALLTLLYNPLDALQPGFQLSFVQVLALIVLVPPITRRLLGGEPGRPLPDARNLLELGWRSVVGLFVVCVVAWLISLPLVLLHFERFAPWAALQSLLLTPLISLTLLVGFAVVVFGLVTPPLGGLLGYVLHGLTVAMTAAVNGLAQMPGSLLETAAPPAWLVLATYAILSLAIIRATRAVQRADDRAPPPALPRRALLAAAAGVAALWLGLTFWRLLPDNDHDLTVHVLAVDDGSAALVLPPAAPTLLVDVGTLHNFDVGRVAIDAAKKLGLRRIDAVSLSHANYDHYSGLPTLLRDFRVDELWTTQPFLVARQPQALREAIAGRAPRVLAIGDRPVAGENYEVEVLWPPPDLDPDVPANDASLVLRLRFAGRAVMLPGDIEHEAIVGLLERADHGEIDLHADVLVAPHHGSVLDGASLAFYQAVAPRVIVVSTGKPRPKLVALMHEAFGDRVPLYSTHELGAVAIRITPAGEIRIETPFADEPE